MTHVAEVLFDFGIAELLYLLDEQVLDRLRDIDDGRRIEKYPNWQLDTERFGQAGDKLYCR